MQAIAAFSVNPDKTYQLAHRMVALGMRESDCEETFVRLGGLAAKTSINQRCP
jgi:hypothetical protein